MDIKRQVAALWEPQEVNMRAQAVTADQIAELKKTFYLGVAATLLYQREGMAPLALTPARMIEHLNAMYAEAMEFLYPTERQ